MVYYKTQVNKLAPPLGQFIFNQTHLQAVKAVSLQARVCFRLESVSPRGRTISRSELTGAALAGKRCREVILPQ